MRIQDAKASKKPVVTGGKGSVTKGGPVSKGPTGVTPPTKIGTGAKKQTDKKKC